MRAYRYQLFQGSVIPFEARKRIKSSGKIRLIKIHCQSDFKDEVWLAITELDFLRISSYNNGS